MNIVTIKINGYEYNLKGDENEEYLHKVASYVNKKFSAIKQNNTKLSVSAIGALASLNIADELFKVEEKIALNTEGYNKLMEENEALFNKGKEENNKEKALVEENERLLSEIKELKFQLQSSKFRIIDLQNKLIDGQVDLAKIKKFRKGV
ncbi:MAG: cell division protein ZapA [Clostridiaceae bacterium]